MYPRKVRAHQIGAALPPLRRQSLFQCFPQLAERALHVRETCQIRLVADPNGGTSFGATGNWIETYGRWTLQAITFTAASNIVTVGAELHQKENLEWNHLYVDSLALVSGGGPPPPTSTPVPNPTLTPSGTNVLYNPALEIGNPGTSSMTK